MVEQKLKCECMKYNICQFNVHVILQFGAVGLIQGDQKVSMHLTITVEYSPHTIDNLKMAITKYIWNVDRAILNAVFKNTVRCVNKCLETGGGHFEHYL